MSKSKEATENVGTQSPTSEQALADFVTLLQDQAVNGKLKQVNGKYEYPLPEGKSITNETNMPLMDGSIRMVSMTLGGDGKHGEAGKITFKLADHANSISLEDVDGIKIKAAAPLPGILQWVKKDVSRDTFFKSFDIPKSSEPITASLDNPIRLAPVRSALHLTDSVITYKLKATHKPAPASLPELQITDSKSISK